MTCPSRSCGAAIDDDSWFCDQCGRELRRCPDCGMIGVGKFCTRHGKPTVPLREAAAQVTVLQKDKPALFVLPTLWLRHESGRDFEISGEVHIGREASPFADFLAAFGAISRRHATIRPEPAGWMVADEGSNNGTRVDGVRVLPGKPLRLTKGSILLLADQRFRIDEVEEP